jgi:hypothetical protein
MNDNKENLFDKLRKDPKGQALLFFGGYLVFFIFVMIIVRVMGSGSTVGKQYDEAKGYGFSTVNITNNNYVFNYSVLLDGNINSYKGNRKDNEERFILTNNMGTYDYYKKDIDYFNNKNGLWIKSDDPYLFNKFFDINNILSLIEKAKLDYKTDYESGKRIYNFVISSTTIHDYLEGIDLDIADNVNEIVVYVDEDDYVEKFEFKLDNYCKAISMCTNELKIVLEYSEYGEVKEITSPLE